MSPEIAAISEPVGDDELDRLRILDTCTVSDACDVLGYDGLATGLAPVWDGAHLCGRVVTVQLDEVDAAAPPAVSVHLGVRAIEASAPGDVIVVANEGRVGMGGWGGLLSLAASGRGVAGVVVDGACRDIDEARELRFPVFAVAATARTARGRVHETSTGSPVRIAGITVSTGDVVVADGSGVVFLQRSIVPEVLREAERIRAREQLMATTLAAEPQEVGRALGAGYENLLRPSGVRDRAPDHEISEESMTSTHVGPTYDVIIIGAGLTGMHQLHRLRATGMSVRVFDAGDGVGGTWYWNKYPGARLDSESFTYGYAFDDELLEQWEWSERFVAQPELERYLNFAADKLDLKRDIQLGARVTAATWHDDDNRWEVRFEDDTVARSTFLVTAIGVFSAPNWPNLTGLDDYRGEWHHTALWPNHDISFTGKRVAVIGTGASGIQIITEIGKDVGHLTVFQRTPNWSAPLRNRPITAEEQAELKAHYPEMFSFLRGTYSGFMHTFDPRSALEVSPEVRQARYEELWAQPGFAKWMGNFHDIPRSREANETYTAFVADKIRERIDDPALHDKLVPSDHPFGTKRVPLENGYFETYNQDNVELVSVKETPIERFTEKGILTRDGVEREFDMIVFATGFDAFTGAFERIEFTGRDGLTLKEKWRNGPKTYLGLQVAGFPNLITEVGPHNKGGFCNIPRCSEQNVDWVTRCLIHLREHGHDRMEASEQAEESWTKHVYEGVAPTLLSTVDSYFFGSNVEGKVRAFVGYMGSLPDFTKRCDEVAANGYEGFVLSSSKQPAATAF